MIQYIQVETDDDGTIVGLGFDSTTGAYSAVKKVLSETSGLPQDASTKDILAKHSGLNRSNSVNDHIAAIKLKAYDEGYDDGRRDMRTDIQERMKQFEEAIKSE